MARYLIDSHIFFWAIDAPERLLTAERSLLAETAQDVAVSVASFWELSIKLAKGGIKLAPGKPSVKEDYFAKHAEAAGFTVLPIGAAEAEYIRELPLIHRDPFDRLLIAQALLTGRTIITRDAVFSSYPGLHLWTAS